MSEGLSSADIIRVLRAFHRCDCHDSLYWTLTGSTNDPDEDTSVYFYAKCCDFFDWGTADAEVIRTEDISLLEATARDLIDIDAGYWLGEMYAARRRGMRPMGAVYRNWADSGMENARVKAMFDACGPEREGI